MKWFVFLMFMMLVVAGLAFSQSDDPKKKLPQEKVTVNKEYDENGNLVRFDSSYSYSWSGDTTLNQFPGDIDLSDFFGWKENFFSNDSVFSVDPFHGMQFNHGRMNDIFEQFSKMFSDSDFLSYRNDSIMKYFSDSLHILPFKGDSLHWKFNQQLNDSSAIRFFSLPDFKFERDSIWQKQQKLLEKHMKELEKNFLQF